MLESREQNAASSDTIQHRTPEQESTEVHHHRYNVRNKYEFIRTLGKGTYGKVKLAVEKGTGRKFAVKAIRKDRIKDKKDMKHIRREMKIMSSLRHPNIIQIHEVFENLDKIVIVMEYASRGELYDYLANKKLTSEVESRTFFKQIVSAVQYCHKLGVVHRDLKLENILLGENHEIKIADFGLANLFKSDQLLHTFCGSPLYASPEIVNGVPYTGPEVDSWSLGVLLYALVYGMMPFDGSDYKMLTKQISNGEYSKQTKHPDAADLIGKMLTVDPLERADIHQIANHYWMHQSPSTDTTVTSKQETVQSMDKNSNYIYSPHEDAYSHPTTTFTPITSPLNGFLPQTAMANGYISPQQHHLAGGSPVEQLSNGAVPSGYISPHQHLASTSPSEQLASGTVLTPCALENCENTTCPLNQRKGILKRFSAPVMTTNLNPVQGTLAPQPPTWSPQYASPVQSNCLNGAMFVKDASCGLQAKDSLKLKTKPLGASGKRRTLRSKKDRESGYYSSPERTPVEVQPVHSTTPVFTFAAPVIKPQLTNMTAENLKPRQQSQNTDTILTQPHYGLPTYGTYVMPIPPQPIPIIEGQTMSYYSPVGVQSSMEPTTRGPLLPYTVTPLNDEDTQPRRQRPISTYSDSSILSSDSFELCTFESPLTSTALFTTVGLTQGNTVMHATQPPCQLLLSTMRPASLPIPVPELPAEIPERSLSPVPSGALTPTSAKLNHDLSQILAPSRPRRRKIQSDSGPAKLGAEQANQLEEMMRQLNIDLERACNQGLDNKVKVSLTASAEV